MLPARNTLQPPPPTLACLGPGIRAYLSFAKGGVGSAPATIINGVAALGCGAQYRRLLAVRRTSIVPPCQSSLPSSSSNPSSLLFSFSLSFFAHPPSTIFADIDEPPCALLSSTWTLPDETRLDVLGREIDRLGNRFSRVSAFFIPSFLPCLRWRCRGRRCDVRFFVSMINFDVNERRFWKYE